MATTSAPTAMSARLSAGTVGVVPLGICASMGRRIPVVLRQQVFAPVAVEVTPHAVNVIGVVVCVVVLDQKRAALYAVVVVLRKKSVCT